MRSFFWSVSLRIQSERGKIWTRKNSVVSLCIQSKCGKIRTRKNSVFGHFSSVQANVLRRIYLYNFNKRDSTRNIFGNISRLFFETAISQKSFERLLVRNLYLSSQLKNYCCGRALKGQVSKFTGGNTVNSFRTLAESHKRLKLTEEFAQSQKKADLRHFIQNSPRRNCDEIPS